MILVITLTCRAAQRTFDGAYMRTALSQLTFSLTVIKIFQPEFFWIGLMNCVLAVGLIITAVLRHRLTMRYKEKVFTMIEERRKASRNMGTSDATASHLNPETYTFLPHFQTAGHIVVFVTLISICVEVIIIYLLARL